MWKFRSLLALLILGALLLATGIFAHPVALAEGSAPPLGTAASFAVLAGSTATNTGDTVVTGDLGVWPGIAVTGFPPGIVTGTIYEADAIAQQAQSDLTTAYDDLAGQACDLDLTDQDLGGLTLTPGVYCFDTSAQLTGVLELDAEDPDAVFVFRIGSTLTTASNSSVSMLNSADPCNVFWQVGSSATLGTETAFAGSILALTSITLDTGADIDGRALARNGAVTMDTNRISNVCAAALTPTATATAETPTVTATAETPTATATAETPTVTATAETPAATATAESPAATATAESPAATAVPAAPTAEIAVVAELPRAGGVAGAPSSPPVGLLTAAGIGLYGALLWFRKKSRG